jgi:ornithine decarboxylase
MFDDEPYYVIDLMEIDRAYERWILNLPCVRPYYAMKCNPDPVILKRLIELGCNFDCASKEEIKLILELTNGDASRIIFAHPCKYPSHICYAKQQNVDLMTFDCEEELHKIKKYHPKADILLRLAVDDSQSLCKFNKKFGCVEANIEKVIKTVKELEMNLVGFSFHVGSGCKSAYTYYDAIRRCNNAMFVAHTYGYDICIIDIGGGFVAHSDDVEFEDIAAKINEAKEDFFSGREVQFIAEPGRFIVQKSHTLIVCVIGKKHINDRFIYYLNDGVYGSFNCIIFDHQDPVLIPMIDFKENQKMYPSQIFGNTCDSMDEIKDSVMLPELDVGDRLCVCNFGAYTTSARSDGFNGYKVHNFQYINNFDKL